MNNRSFFFIIPVLFVMLFISSCGYLQMNPPPDANISEEDTDESGWMAAAANMLAAADYGNGNNVQEKAEDIYANLIEEFGTDKTGWTDAALSWWLKSEHNRYPENPYKLVTVYGHKSPKLPWANPDAVMFIGNLMRKGNFVAISITWPNADVDNTGQGGHTINCWGDNESERAISENPKHIRVSDPHRNDGGSLQTYEYDFFYEPNPDGTNEGAGWYFSYDNNHPYIKNIIVLSPVTTNNDNEVAVRKMGAYRLMYPEEHARYKLQYYVAADSLIDVFNAPPENGTDFNKRPSISKGKQKNKALVEWSMKKRDSTRKWFTIFSELIIPEESGILVSDVKYELRNGSELKAAPDVYWNVIHQPVNFPSRIENISGGYIIGSFDILKEDTVFTDDDPYAEYRFISQYSFDGYPREFTLYLYAETAYCISNIKLGHKYGLLSPDSLWTFKNWIVDFPDKIECRADTFSVVFYTPKKLYYPEGEDYYKRRAKVE